MVCFGAGVEAHITKDVPCSTLRSSVADCRHNLNSSIAINPSLCYTAALLGSGLLLAKQAGLIGIGASLSPDMLQCRSKMKEQVARRGIYQGWLVVATVTVMMAITSGSRFLFGVVLKPLSEEYGWSREALGTAVTINVVIMTLLQPLVGVAVDRWGSRRILLWGTVLTALLSLPMTKATHLWQIYLFYSVIASLAFAAVSPVNITKLVGGWFTKQRGMALSISSSGAAFGQLAIIPIATWIMAHYGWRVSYWSIALVILLAMFPLCFLLIRDAPPGASEDPAVMQAAEENPELAQIEDGPKISIKQAIRIPAYWQMSFGFFVCGYTMAFTQVHMVPYFLDMPEHSHSTMQLVASTALSVVGAASIIGAISIGYLADRIGHRQMLAATYFLRGLSYLLLLLAGPNMVGIYAAAIVMGVSWTSTTPLTSALAADIYGRSSLGTIFGFIFSAMNLGVGVGSMIAGRDYDITGNYQMALMVNAFLGFAAAAVIQMMRVRALTTPVPVAPASSVLTSSSAD